MLEWLRRGGGRTAGRVQNNTITTSKELAEVLLGGSLAVSGISVTPRVAMGVAAVQAAVRVICENTGMLPFPLYERTETSLGEGRRKAREHSLWKLINLRPNNFMSAQEFRETLTAQMLLYRHAYAFKNTADGEVRELIPIPADRVEFKQTADLSIIYKVWLADGSTREFSQDKIFHLRDMSAYGLNGPSRVRECADAIGLTKSLEKYAGKFFAKSARPSGILIKKSSFADDAEVERIKETWNAAHGGENSGGTALVDGDFDWKSITHTAEESQNLETRKFQVTEVARIFRLPPHKIGDMERATFSNIDAQEIDFYTNSMMPWYRRWEIGVDGQLLKESDREKFYSKIDNRALLRGDSNARGAYYLRMKQGKIMTTNEIRALEDMDPIKGGDVLENPSTTAGDPIKEGDNNVKA